jgi:hypothetical protein
MAPDASYVAPTEPVGLIPLARRHKRGAALIVGILVLFIALTAASIAFNNGSTPLSDGTPCTQWPAASRAQQLAYARLYIRESGTTHTAAQIRSIVTGDCVQAAYLGESDDVTLIAALHQAF